jgi:hypothetical protein
MARRRPKEHPAAAPLQHGDGDIPAQRRSRLAVDPLRGNLEDAGPTAEEARWLAAKLIEAADAVDGWAGR